MLKVNMGLTYLKHAFMCIYTYTPTQQNRVYQCPIELPLWAWHPMKKGKAPCTRIPTLQHPQASMEVKRVPRNGPDNEGLLA